jgi:hypothetical protein
MDPQLAALDEAASEIDACLDEDHRVREWRAEQLRRLGLTTSLARAFADVVDWHDIAALVARGCTPALALDIVR